jgi:phosphatidyl-myo-inositol dimannoside synthase
MNIVIPTADYPPIEGGIGTVSLQVSRELAKLGHTVTVIAPYFRGMESFDANEPLTVIRFRGYNLSWFRFFPMFLKSAPHIRQADLVLGINIAYGATMAALLNQPYITFAYAYEFLKFGDGKISDQLRKVYNKSIKTISISSFTTQALQEFGIHESKIKTVLPGAPTTQDVHDTTIEHMRENLKLGHGPLLLAVARLIPRKGYATLISSLPKILEQFPDTQLVCVGRGPLLESLRKQAFELGVGDAVRMTGYLTDEEIATLYKMCTLFVLPTGTAQGGQIEGFGLVFAEANAYGKPAIAGRSGGTIDAIIHNKTGLLIEPDDPKICADAILELLNDPGRAKAMGEAGKYRVETELNWTAFTLQMMKVVESEQ